MLDRTTFVSMQPWSRHRLRPGAEITPDHETMQ